MPSYKVVLSFEVWREYEVEAEDETEALDKAENMWYKGVDPLDESEELVDDAEVEEI